MLWFIVIMVLAVVFLKGFDRIAGRSQTTAAAKMKAATHGSPSTSDELTKLAALRDSGDLTDEEFQAQKRKLLR